MKFQNQATQTQTSWRQGPRRILDLTRCEFITVTTKLGKHLQPCFGEAGGNRNERKKAKEEEGMVETRNPVRNPLCHRHTLSF